MIWTRTWEFYLEEQFGLSVDFCENIEDNRDTPSYDDVEKEVKITYDSAPIWKSF